MALVYVRPVLELKPYSDEKVVESGFWVNSQDVETVAQLFVGYSEECEGSTLYYWEFSGLLLEWPRLFGDIVMKYYDVEGHYFNSLYPCDCGAEGPIAKVVNPATFGHPKHPVEKCDLCGHTLFATPEVYQGLLEMAEH
jgi:hypothetical protein